MGMPGNLVVSVSGNLVVSVSGSIHPFADTGNQGPLLLEDLGALIGFALAFVLAIEMKGLLIGEARHRRISQPSSRRSSRVRTSSD